MSRAPSVPDNVAGHAMRLLAGDDAVSRDAASRVADSGRWPALVELAIRWNLLSSLEVRFAELGIELPQRPRQLAKAHATRQLVKSTLAIQAGVTALSALQAASIPSAGFKGLAAVALLYPGPRSRALQDTDILIHEAALAPALQVLENCGFRSSFGGSWRQYISFIRHSPGTAGNEAISLTDASGCTVDLHWRLGGIPTEILLNNVCHVEILNRRVPLIAPEYSMLLSVHHALRNDFVPGDIARDVCDFARWLALPVICEAAPEKREAVRADAERWGLLRGRLGMAQIVALLRDEPACGPPVSAPLSDTRAASRLCSLYLYQLRHDPMNTDLAYLTTYRPFLQVVKGMSSGWTEYRESMQMSERSNGEISYSLPRRLWRLCKSATQLRPAQWKQLRTLAREKNGLCRSRS